jgi:hypothetical protein
MFKAIVITLALICLPALAKAETIHYKISKMGVSGKADLNFAGETNYKDHKTFLIEFKADGFNFQDTEKIYLDPKTFKPIFVERNINIFGKKEEISEDYQTDGEIKIKKTTNGKTEDQVLKKKGDVENIYGFIYRYRKEGSFKMGDTINVVLPTKDIKITLQKQTKIKAAGKNYDAFYMESAPNEYKIWFDTSDKKLPLRIAGSGNMVMTGYEE